MHPILTLANVLTMNQGTGRGNCAPSVPRAIGVLLAQKNASAMATELAI